MAIINLTNTAVEKLQPAGIRKEYRDEKLKGLLVRVQPSGKKTYMLNYARGKYITLGDASVLRAAAAREIAMEELEKAAIERDPLRIGKKKRDWTFSEFFRKYYEVYVQENQRGAKQALARYRYLCTQAGSLPLSDFTPFKIAKFQNRRKNEGVKDSTINRDVSAIQAMLEYAVKQGFLAEHPFKGKIKKYPEAWDNPRYLSPEEKTRLRAALQARDNSSREERKRLNRWRQERNRKPLPEIGIYSDYLTPLVLTAMLTGLRRGELFNLAWQDIDTRAKTLQVRTKGVKPGKTRTVPLNAECRDMLIEWKQLTEYSHPGGYVFPNRKGERLDNINTAFSNLLKAAEITGFRFNDLRHHYASMLVQEGIQLYAVKELLGHSDFKMTQRYAHLAPDNLKEAARVLDNIRGREIEQAEKEPFERRWYRPGQVS